MCKKTYWVDEIMISGKKLETNITEPIRGIGNGDSTSPFTNEKPVFSFEFGGGSFNSNSRTGSTVIIFKHRNIHCMAILLIGAFFFLFMAKHVRGDILIVDDDGVSGFSSISSALANSTDGDVIRIFQGSYHESLVINTSVQLIGNASETVIILSGSSEVGITILADNVTLSGISLRGEGQSQSQAIVVKGNMSSMISLDIRKYGDGVILQSNNNHLTDTQFMDIRLRTLSVLGSHCNVIENNTFSHTKLFGIFISHSSDNTFTSNLIKHNKGAGIYMENAIGNRILHNQIMDNENGIILNFFNNHGNQQSGINVINYNRIVGNEKYGMNATLVTGITINASMNYWGSSFGPFHTTLNDKGLGDNISGELVISPWLDENWNVISHPEKKEDSDEKKVLLHVLIIILISLTISLIKVSHFREKKHS